MRRKFKIMTHQIEQLKEEILAKDHALINEHFAYKRLKDEMKGRAYMSLHSALVFVCTVTRAHDAIML